MSNQTVNRTFQGIFSAAWIVVNLVIVALPHQVSAEDALLADHSFWQTNVGWWRSDNTYFDPDLNYNIRSYNSVIHIEIDGRTYRETEYKSYAPSQLAFRRGGGLITEEEGIEAVTVSIGELVDDTGTVRIIETQPAIPGTALTEIRILDATNAMRVTIDPETGLEAYRMMVSLPVPDKRYISNYGLVSATDGAAAPGDLRGFSVFRGTRIPDAEAATWRARYQAQNKVAAVIAPKPDGSAGITRLDTP